MLPVVWLKVAPFSGTTLLMEPVVGGGEGEEVGDGLSAALGGDGDGFGAVGEVTDEEDELVLGERVGAGLVDAGVLNGVFADADDVDDSVEGGDACIGRGEDGG